MLLLERMILKTLIKLVFLNVSYECEGALCHDHDASKIYAYLCVI